MLLFKCKFESKHEMSQYTDKSMCLLTFHKSTYMIFVALGVTFYKAKAVFDRIFNSCQIGRENQLSN